jgi:SpoVK/Ycf46/Vps4 family AAA+-type ATPase
MREILVEIPSVRWSDIGGYEKIKQQLLEAVEYVEYYIITSSHLIFQKCQNFLIFCGNYIYIIYFLKNY